MLDTLGVGLLGTNTPVFNVTYQYSKVNYCTSPAHISLYKLTFDNNEYKNMILSHFFMLFLCTSTLTSKFVNYLFYQGYQAKQNSSVWGRSGSFLPPHYAAFVNGVAVGYQ